MKQSIEADLINTRGSFSSELFNPTADAEDILAKDRLDYGRMFTYLFRRFGYPASGWDGYKDLVRYYLKTPMEGVYLLVYPHHPQKFAYAIKNEYSRECFDYINRPGKEWRENFRRWAKETKNECIFSQWDIYHKEPHEIVEEQQAIWSEWIESNHPEIEETTDRAIQFQARQEFWAWMEGKELALTKEYQQIAPYPQQDYPYNFPEGTLGYQIREALKEAIRDLKRPVSIRDWAIDIHGKVSDEERHQLVEPSNMAGFGVYTEVYEDFDLYSDYMEKLATIGGGSILEGMRLTQHLLESAKS